ncbi:hypothetical protein BJY52DRAFT_947626 [Lactarius psammicola]|nr:hypothetical protein BJY52DRAFT_947626 [Lactarius psammicola]
MPPRPTVVAVVLLITVVLILLLRPFSATLHGYSSYYRNVFGPSRSLRTWLADEEARYAVAVQERLELIKKWGPRDDAVDPYPTHGELYTIWDFFIPAFQCPHRVQRVGTLGDGGKWVCGLDRVAKQDKCVIYSFGLFHFVLLSSFCLAPQFRGSGLNFFFFYLCHRCQRRVLLRIDTVEARTVL